MCPRCEIVGSNSVMKWQGKPLFVRHRTQSEIDDARAVDVGSLLDQEGDEVRNGYYQNLGLLFWEAVCHIAPCLASIYAGWAAA